MYGSVSRIRTKKDLEVAFRIRAAVFVSEQKIDPKIERDIHDFSCTHFLIKYNKKSVGTCRLRFVNGKAKLERLAVLKKYRGLGLGKLGIIRMVKYCERKGIKKIYMHAQYYLKGYYEKLGFVPCGKPFFEAKLKHIKMMKCYGKLL